MKSKIQILFVAVFIFSFTFAFSQMVILSGPENASYHRFTDDIISVAKPSAGTALVNQVSGGSSFNFDQLADAASPYKLALIQSDYLYLMQAIDMKDNTNKTGSIKVVMPLANEEIHVITKESSGIKTLPDLQKKRLAIGTKEQGTYSTANYIKDRSQVYWNSYNVPFDEMLNELFMDRIDAFMFIGSAPIDKLNLDPQVMRDKMTAVELQNFNDWAKYYDNDTIRSSDYKWLDHDVPTFSVKTLLIVNEAKLTDEERTVVSQIQTGILNNFDVLKMNGHPKWNEVNPLDWNESDWPLFK
jgi:TRAP transporter TAXI family solute receptor